MSLQNAPHQSGRVLAKVCFITPDKQIMRDVRLPKGASIERAIHASGILPMCPEIDLKHHKVGVFSKFVNLSDKVTDGDRIEIYEPARASGKNRNRTLNN